VVTAVAAVAAAAPAAAFGDDKRDPEVVNAGRDDEVGERGIAPAFWLLFPL
jgi:hypothetical protein